MPSLRTGGGNRVFVELARALAGHYSVEISVPAGVSDKPVFDTGAEIKLNKIGFTAANLPARLLNIVALLWHVAAKRDSIVVVSDPLLSLFSFLFNKKRTYRFLQSDDYILFDDLHVLRSSLLLKIYKALTKLSYRYKVNYIFNSRFVYDAFVSVSGRTDVPCRLVHPGVNFDYFNNRDSRPAAPLGICLVGRSHPLKGLQDFLTAWRDVKPQLPPPGATVSIISSDNLGHFDLSGMSVIRPQNDRDMAAGYNAAHIFVYTSRWDGFGLPPLEAMACGCAVILSDCGGPSEYAVAGRNCLLYQPGDIAALRALILHLAGDRQLQSRLSEEGQKTARQFSWAAASRQFLDIISNQLSPQP